MPFCKFCTAPLANPRAVQCGALACRRALKAANMRKAKRARKAETWVPRDCGGCGEPIGIERRADALFCSRACIEKTRDRTEYSKAYAERNLVRQRAWRAANPERVAESAKRYEEQRKLAQREWRKRNPARNSGYIAQRRGLLKEAQEGLRTITPKEWQSVLRQWNHRCAYCREDRQLTMDHVIPISRGGRHSIGNLVPACKSCNSAKRDKFISEWKAGKIVRRAVHS